MRKVFLPTSLAELFKLLAAAPQSRIMAGGTDLLVSLRQHPDSADPIICLERIAELSQVEEQPDASVSIGACVNFSQIVAHPLLQRHYPVLAEAAATVGGPAIRNMASIGGNIVTASPAADCLPPLYLLGASVELLSLSGSRRMPIADFISGPRRTALQALEIIRCVILPAPIEWTLQRYEKVGLRKSQAIAVASCAAALRLAADGTVAEARLAWGSVGPTVMRCAAAEQALIGRPLSGESIAIAAQSACSSVQPIDDLRASAHYRRQLAGNLLQRLLG